MGVYARVDRAPGSVKRGEDGEGGGRMIEKRVKRIKSKEDRGEQCLIDIPRALKILDR